jgi:AcrR family transcriptional regulator
VSSPGKRARQKRGQLTYDTLIGTAFELLDAHEFDDVTIAGLTKHAGYSVGAFYAQFKSKDELLEAMVERHLEERHRTRVRLIGDLADKRHVTELVADIVRYYWKRRRFWRAALARSMREPDFWEPIRKHGREFASLFISRLSLQTNRPLTEEEQTNIRFAFQIMFGTINNTIINRPGPIFMDEELFIANLARAFQLVSSYDDLMDVKRSAEAGSGKPD